MELVQQSLVGLYLFVAHRFNDPVVHAEEPEECENHWVFLLKLFSPIYVEEGVVDPFRDLIDVFFIVCGCWLELHKAVELKNKVLRENSV